MFRSAISFILILAATSAAPAVPINLVPGTYTQNFDTLVSSGSSATLPTGWAINETGSAAAVNQQYTAGTGSGNAGDVYSFGAAGSSDRALGTLFSNTNTSTFGAEFTNNTGATITELNISYTGEQWRRGNTSGSGADRLDFKYSTNATSLTTGTFIDFNDLDFSGPNTSSSAVALNGNDPANQSARSGAITGLSIAPGATFWIRWTDFDLAPGSDDGLGVDNFSLTVNGGGPAPVDPTPVAFSAGSIIGPANQAPLLGAIQSPGPAALTTPTDGFRIFQRGVTPSIPAALLDDSASAGDQTGIVRGGDTGAFFGSVSLASAGIPGVADFNFNIGSLSNIKVAMDFAAMGDFELLEDRFDFSYSIDGAAFQPLFTSGVNEILSQIYTLESGAAILLPHPVLMNGTLLTNVFAKFQASVLGTGSVLTLRFSSTSGVDEAFAFRNIEVTGTPAVGAVATPEPASMTLIALAMIGLSARRRRMA